MKPTSAGVRIADAEARRLLEECADELDGLADAAGLRGGTDYGEKRVEIDFLFNGTPDEHGHARLVGLLTLRGLDGLAAELKERRAVLLDARADIDRAVDACGDCAVRLEDGDGSGTLRDGVPDARERFAALARADAAFCRTLLDAGAEPDAQEAFAKRRRKREEVSSIVSENCARIWREGKADPAFVGQGSKPTFSGVYELHAHDELFKDASGAVVRLCDRVPSAEDFRRIVENFQHAANRRGGA